MATSMVLLRLHVRAQNNEMPIIMITFFRAMNSDFHRKSQFQSFKEQHSGVCSIRQREDASRVETLIKRAQRARNKFLTLCAEFQ